MPLLPEPVPEPVLYRNRPYLYLTWPGLCLSQVGTLPGYRLTYTVTPALKIIKPEIDCVQVSVEEEEMFRK